MLTPLTRRFRLLALGIVLLLVVPAVASSSLRGSSADAKVLRVGTSFYISSLNPFVGIETNDSMAYSMVYPQLVQYVPGPRIGSDWASSWKRGNGGLTWTFRLKKGKWSDGTPLTSADAVWTINTVLKYKAGPTSYVASSYEGIKGASAPDPQTLVISYSRPIAPALSNLSQTYILPKHVWSTKLGKNGKGLREFRPQENLPNVSGAPTPSRSTSRRERQRSSPIPTSTDRSRSRPGWRSPTTRTRRRWSWICNEASSSSSTRYRTVPRMLRIASRVSR